MNISGGSTPIARRGERGASRLKLIVVLAVIAVMVYMGIQYVPVAYNAYLLRRSMDENVEKGAALQLPNEQRGPWVENQIRAGASDYGVPPNAKITHTFQDGQLRVTLQFARPINLLPGIWTYNYLFDYTAKSNTFLNAH